MNHTPGETSKNVKYPEIKVQLPGGNAYTIAAAVVQGLKLAKVGRAEINTFKKEALSGDYDNIIQTAMRWVNVILRKR